MTSKHRRQTTDQDAAVPSVIPRALPRTPPLPGKLAVPRPQNSIGARHGESTELSASLPSLLRSPQMDFVTRRGISASESAPAQNDFTRPGWRELKRRERRAPRTTAVSRSARDQPQHIGPASRVEYFQRGDSCEAAAAGRRHSRGPGAGPATKCGGKRSAMLLSCGQRSSRARRPRVRANPSSLILHPSSFIPHPSSLILHPSSFILQPSSFSLQPSASILFEIWPGIQS